RRRLSIRQPVIAKRALLRDADVLIPLRAGAAFDHPVGAGGHARTAPVAYVVLDDHRAELTAKQRSGRADVETGRVGAVFTHIGRHQPPEVRFLLIRGTAALGRGLHARYAEIDRFPLADRLFDEGDMPPTVRVERVAVVVGTAEHVEEVLGNVVPLLAGHLARLAADAHRRVGEEPLPRRRFVTGV